MNKLATVAAAALLTVSTLAAGCIGCSAYSGGGDRVLSRGQDSIILCDNAGFIAASGGVTIEGTYTSDADGGIIAVRGDNTTTAFTLAWSDDGASATTDDLGDGSWTKLDMNQTALDHADVQCQDLVSRSWWQ